jgi:prevent-host-death family protein
MKTISSVEAQNNFGNMVALIKEGEPVTVTQYGKPTMLILPYAIGSDALRQYNARRMAQFMDALPPSNPNAPELTDDELTKLIHELRP